MDDIAKEVLQAKHRTEEAQARERINERKARTRRLIQTGAIVEKVIPNCNQMSLTALETYLTDLQNH